MKGKIDSNPKIVKNLDTSISTMNSSFSQKKSINSGLEWHIKQDSPNSYGTLYPTAEEYRFFSKVHGTFSKIDHNRTQNKCY